MYEFLWFLILIATLVSLSFARAKRKLASRPEVQPYHGLLDRVIAWCARFSTMELRWWLVSAVLVFVAAVYLKNDGMRTSLNLLLFFARHPVLMTLLLAISLVGFVLAWRGEWTMRRLVGAAVLGAVVTLLLVFEWYCLFIALLFLALFGLLWIQSNLVLWLRWVGSLLTTFLAAGLLLSRVLYDPTEASIDVGDYLLIGVVVTVTALGLIWAWQTQRQLLGAVFGLMLALIAGGLALSKFGYPVPTWFAGIADYVLIVVLAALAFSGVVWVRSLQLQPLGWVSATMILFLGSGLFFSSILYGEPEDFADIEDQFKYGSIGSDHVMTRGIPYFIWEILPVMFPPEDILVKILPEEVREIEKVKYAPRYGKADKLKGTSYEAFGLVKEENKTVRLIGQDKEIPIDRPIGFSKRKVFGMDFIGINCAFCHVSTIRKEGPSKPQIMLGMPANTTDIELFFLFLFGTAEERSFTSGPVMDKILAKRPEIKFGRQVGKYGISGVCQEIRNSVHRISYRLALIPLTGKYVRQLRKDFYFIDPHHPDRVPRFGPGRVDAWSPGKTTLVKPPLEVRYPGGIIDHTSIWNQKARKGMRLHWDGNIHVLQERNIIAGLVVNGPNIECLDTKRLDRINNWLDGRPAPRFDDFVPPQEGYGGVKELVKRREQGRLIFQHWCASCHAPGGERIGQVEPLDGGGVPQPGVQGRTVQLDTDPARMLSFTAELANALNTLGTDQWQLRNFKAQKGYVNMLLDGIWLRAPYLHNGSVPTMRDLLNKPCEAGDKPTCRPQSFYRGQDVYDWKNLGFKSEVTIEPGDIVDIAVRNEPAEKSIPVDERGIVAMSSGVKINAWGLTAAEAGESILVEREAKALMEKNKLTLKEGRDKALAYVTAEAVERLKKENKLTENDAKQWVHKRNPLATVQIHKKVPVKLFEFKTTLLGNSNRGHLYGTDLTPEEKELLIEFLKSL